MRLAQCLRNKAAGSTELPARISSCRHPSGSASRHPRKQVRIPDESRGMARAFSDSTDALARFQTSIRRHLQTGASPRQDASSGYCLARTRRLRRVQCRDAAISEAVVVQTSIRRSCRHSTRAIRRLAPEFIHRASGGRRASANISESGTWQSGGLGSPTGPELGDGAANYVFLT
jgi:hypothetical protein